MFARGEITERECARLIGIQPVSVWRLKTRWLEFGDAIWIHTEILGERRKIKNKIGIKLPPITRFLLALRLLLSVMIAPITCIIPPCCAMNPERGRFGAD